MEDRDYQMEIEGYRTSHRWATFGIVIVVLLALVALVWAIDYYFDAQGVRVFLIAVGVAAIVLLIYALSIGVSAIYGRQAMAHHNNVLRGIIDFQRADDYGEVARQVAVGMGGAIRSGTNLDARVLQVANQIAQQQQRQLVDAQRNQPAPSTWGFDEDDAPAPQQGGGFRRVE